MCGNARQIGTVLIREALLPIRVDQAMLRIGSIVVVRGTTRGLTWVQEAAPSATPITDPASWASASASRLPANLSMNLRTHLSRSNGYRELGMFDESILELEEIEGEDRWHSMVNH